MDRFKFVVTCAAAAIIVALSQAFAATGNETSHQDISAEGCIDPTWCPPPKVETLTVCLGDTVYDTLVFTLDNPQDTAYNLALLDGPGELEIERSDALYGYYRFVS